MDKLLLVAASDNAMKMLSQLVSDRRFEHTFKCSSGAEARRTILDNDYDIAIINTPLPDEFGYDLAELASHSIAAVIILVKGEYADKVEYELKDSPVMVVEKPTSIVFFSGTLKMADVMFRKTLIFEKENRILRQKLDEAKTVGTAKCILVEKNGLTEQQAHRYIEKTAMDTRKPRTVIAREIIDAR